MSDRHTWTGTPTEEETERMEERIRLFIFPNEVETTAQQTAFDKAVAWQIVHEKSADEVADNIPDGVKGFKIGDFSMDFGGSGYNGSGLTKRTMCPAAYSVLLRNGLLYRGLEGRC